MRLNGSNKIIHEDDILLNSGNSLSSELQQYSDGIELLLREMKWMYKYGGTGSGHGSGGGGTGANYKLIAYLNDLEVKNNSIVLKDGIGYYNLRIKITKPNGGIFSVKYKYPTTTAVIERTVILSVDNSWEANISLYVDNNDTLIITATDGDTEQQIKTDYITLAYTYDLGIYDPDGTALNSELLVENYSIGGVDFILNYNIAIDAKVSYYFVFKDEITERLIVTDRKGFVKYNLNKSWFRPENAGLYNIKCVIDMEVTGQEPFTITKDISFNLIPANLYLLVTPEIGELYSQPLPEGADFYLYYNGVIVFNARAYYGTNLNRSFKFDLYVNNELYKVDEQYVDERKLYTFRPEIYSEKWSTVKFVVTFGTTKYEKIYYLYVLPPSNDLDWYDEVKSASLYINYYRNTDSTDVFRDYRRIIKMTTNDNKKTISGILKIDVSGDVKYDTHFAFSIQYSHLNKSDDLLIETKNIVGNDEYTSLQITLKQITLQSRDTMKYYLPISKDYDPNNIQLYHLIEIYSKYIKSIINDHYYDVSVFIDGRLEMSTVSLQTMPLLINKIILHPDNYSINLLECSYFLTDKKLYQVDGTTSDIIAYLYYSKYANSYLLETISRNIDLISYVSNFKYRADGYILCNPGDIDNIAMGMDTPVIKFTIDLDKYTEDVLNYFGTSFKENDPVKPFNVAVSYGKHSKLSNLANLPNNTLFTIVIQGSSTKGNKSKNLDLELVNLLEDAEEILYSPNLSNSDPTTFLPEHKFTLKSDVVDSSHSNNVSIGRFVNTYCKKFKNATGETGYYADYIKNCLDGFPVLVFVEVTKTVNGILKTECFYWGVYNFNLGRSSYYNLGYNDLDVFQDDRGNPLLPEAGTGFTFVTIPRSNIKKGLVVAEVLGNGAYFDFSQYDKSILFDLNDNDNGAMFGDIVFGTSSTYQTSLINFVKQVAKGGLYIFKTMGKTFGPYSDKYSGENENGPTNQVPDNTILYRRILDNTSSGTSYEIAETGFTGNEFDLSSLIVYNELDDIPLYLDFDSISEYYTICMAFGLFDSVLKNLNIKTWNGKTFYAAFYDMDTSNGLLNDGTRAGYKAFSDYWKLEYDSAGNPLAIKIYRDYHPDYAKHPEAKEEGGYDTPSSYLFAIAKYARMFLKESDSTVNFPQELWAKWRSNKYNKETGEGCLSSALRFVDEIFGHHLSGIDRILMNYNYRTKYYVLDNTAFSSSDTDSNSTKYNSENFLKFNGSLVYEVTDWLDARFKILDAYLNINKLNIYILYILNGKWVDSKDYAEPIYSGIYDHINNSNITLMTDIFESGNVKLYNSAFNFIITSQKDSPLIVKTPNLTYKYITGLDPTNIKFNTGGNLTVAFYGSEAWETLNSVNSFIPDNGLLYINSDRLLDISGTLGTLAGSIILKTPAVKNVTLTSPNYSASFVLPVTGITYPNLNTVDISGSKISLELNTLTVRTVNISNVKSGSIKINNCSELTSVIKDNVTVDSLTINPYPVNLDCIISGSKIQTLTVQAPEGSSDKTFSVTNDLTLSTLSVSGFSIVKIEGCNKLTSVTLDSSVKTLIIRNCSSLATSLTINTNTNRVVDLTRLTNLVSFNFENTLNYDLVLFPNKTIDLLYRAFYNSAITNIDSRGTIRLCGKEIFLNCSKFKLKNAGQTYTLAIDPNLTDLSGMFYCTNKGRLTLEDVKFFMEAIPEVNNVTTINDLFRNNNITYTANNLKTDLKGTSHNYFDFRKFNKVTSALRVFYLNKINALHPAMVEMGLAVPNSSLSLYLFIGLQSTTDNYNLYPIHLNTNIKNKITSWDGYETKSFICCDELGNLIRDLYLKDFLQDMPNLTSLNRFTPLYSTSVASEIVTAMGMTPGTLDVTDAFEGFTKISSMYAVFNNYSKPIVGILDAFKDLTTLKSVNWVLNSYCERLELWDLFNWETLLKGGNTAPFVDCSFPKHILFPDYLKIWGFINEASNIEDIRYFFNNCEIEITGDHLVVDIPLTTNKTRIKNVRNLFSSCTILDGDRIIPFNLENNFFLHLPNVTIAVSMFSNTELEAAIPFNFFNKRLAEIKTSVYYKHTTEEGTTYLPAYLYLNKYNETLTDISSIFYNTRWKTVESRHFRTPELLPSRNRLEVVIDDETYTFYNGSYYTKTNNRYTLYVIPRDYIAEDLDWKGYQLEDGSYIKAGKIGETDSQGITFNEQSTYYNNAVHKIWNYPIDESSIDLYIIPPDFFRGCASNCAITSSLSNYDNSRETLEGLLPANVFRNNDGNFKTFSISSVFLNLNVLPRLVSILEDPETGEDLEIYQFVPDNFTNTTALSSAFNFRLRLLASVNGHNIMTYVMSNESVPKAMSTLSTPGTVYGSFWNGGGQDGWTIALYNKPNIVKVNIIGTKEVDGKISNAGINMTYFNNLYLNGLINSMFVNIMYGPIFNEGYDIAKANGKTPGDSYIINVGTTNVGFGLGIKLPKASANFSNIVKFINYNTNYRPTILLSLIPTDSREIYKLTYINITFQ